MMRNAQVTSVYAAREAVPAVIAATFDVSRPFCVGRPGEGSELLVADADGNPVATGAFSSDGHTLVLAGRYTSDKVQLWNVTDPEHPTRSGPSFPGGADLMALSPDGHTLATVAQTFTGGAPGDGEVKLWNITDHNHSTPLGPPLSGYNSRVTDMAFSPDGHTLATSGSGLRLWNVSDPAHPAAIGRPFAVNALELHSLAFTPDSKTLAFGGADGTVRLWPLGTDQTTRQICANTDAPSRPQWQKYLSALPYRPTCA